MKPETINRKAKEIIDHCKVSARLQELKEDEIKCTFARVRPWLLKISLMAFPSWKI